jgi:nucleoid-associated protein YejK
MICFLVNFAFNPFGIHLGFGVFLGEKISVAENAIVRNSCMFQAMKAYMECLKANKYESEKCRKFSKDYLECRMERYQSIILKVLSRNGCVVADTSLEVLKELEFFW